MSECIDSAVMEGFHKISGETSKSPQKSDAEKDGLASDRKLMTIEDGLKPEAAETLMRAYGKLGASI
jgi:hypothetical protein